MKGGSGAPQRGLRVSGSSLTVPCSSVFTPTHLSLYSPRWPTPSTTLLGGQAFRKPPVNHQAGPAVPLGGSLWAACASFSAFFDYLYKYPYWPIPTDQKQVQRFLGFTISFIWHVQTILCHRSSTGQRLQPYTFPHATLQLSATAMLVIKNCLLAPFSV